MATLSRRPVVALRAVRTNRGTLACWSALEHGMRSGDPSAVTEILSASPGKLIKPFNRHQQEY
jgi:hypothetical protein